MTQLLFYIFIAECVALVGWGLMKPGRIYEFPFLAGATFSGFVMLQLFGLMEYPHLPAGALDKTLIMTILCLSMCYIGYIWNPAPFQFTNRKFNHNRLLLVGAALGLAGSYFFFLISRLPKEQVAFSGWTGLPVMYLFFAVMMTYGFMIGVTMWTNFKYRSALALLLFGSTFYLHRIIFAGRRAVAIEFCLALSLGAWFAWRKAVPRLVMLLAIPIGGIISCGIGVHQYREDLFVNDKSPLEIVAEIPVGASVDRLLTAGGEEMKNAVYMIDYADKTGEFDYGIYHWNALVESYVPRQVVGEKMKKSLMVPPALGYYRIDRDIDGHYPHIGTTVSGMTGCFQSFWYFGCLGFFFVAYVMRRLYEAAREGQLAAQVIYMIVVTQSLHVATHELHNFIKPWVHMSFFLFPALAWASVKVMHKPAHWIGQGAPAAAAPGPVMAKV